VKQVKVDLSMVINYFNAASAPFMVTPNLKLPASLFTVADAFAGNSPAAAVAVAAPRKPRRVVFVDMRSTSLLLEASD